LDFRDGVIVLSGGGFSQPLTGSFRLGENNQVTDTGTNGLRLTFNRRNGSFAGSIIDPRTGKRLQLRGISLQSENSGWGYFLLSDKSTGAVWLGPSKNAPRAVGAS